MEGQQSSLVAGLQNFGSGALVAGRGVLRWIGGLLGWVVLPVYFSFFLLAEKGKGIDFEQFPAVPQTGDPHRRGLPGARVRQHRGGLLPRPAHRPPSCRDCCFATGFSIVGLKYGFVLGLALGFLNIVPYLGSIVGLSVALPLGFFQHGGGIWTVLWVLVVFTVVQMIEGYVLTPKVMGGPHRPPPHGDHRRGVLLGLGAGRHHGHDPGDPADRVSWWCFWRLARDKYMTELV